MTSVITDATSTEGIVLGADDIKHLTNGQGESVGFVIIVNKTAIYIPNDLIDKQNTLDKINDTLDKVKDTLDKVVEVMQELSTIATNASIPVTGVDGMALPIVATAGAIDPAFPANILNPFSSSVDTLKDAIDDLKDEVTTIKDELK